MELSIIVPARDAASTLGAQLEALEPQLSASMEVLVVDDASRDGTAELVRGWADRGVTLLHGTGAGPSAARNLAVARARSDALAFCDADDVVGVNWVRGVLDGLSVNDYVTGPTDVELLNEPWLLSFRGRSVEATPRLFEILPFAPSCNLGIRRELLLRVGGFDDSLRVGEDLDLALRLHLLEVQLAWNEMMLVHYRYRDSSAAIWRQGRTYGQAKAAMAKRMRQAGIEGVPRTEDPGKWLWLLYRSWQALAGTNRARWLWQAGLRVGYVAGSIRYRTVLI